MHFEVHVPYFNGPTNVKAYHPNIGGQVIAIAEIQTKNIIVKASFLDLRLLE